MARRIRGEKKRKKKEKKRGKKEEEERRKKKRRKETRKQILGKIELNKKFYYWNDQRKKSQGKDKDKRGINKGERKKERSR